GLIPMRPSPAAWALRGALALAAAGLGYFGVTHSLAQVAAGTDPAHAHRLAPGDGRITAALAEKAFLDDAGPAAQPR
ncbi:hypothetical protein ACSLVP_27590, partial [Klebsiella pneumoniae]|uniref:hypothetical protein n=1 Tax=Klebsiella pneumoniae TaxID=573 RepID=UPI003EDF7266